MIRAVLFDFGGVLAEGGKAGRAARLMSRLYGIDAVHIRLSPTRRRFLGALSYLDRLTARIYARLPKTWRWFGDSLIVRFAPAFVRSDAVYGLAAALRSNSIRTGIFSNVFTILADVHKRHGDYDNFAPVILSCAEKTAKPDLDIYERALASRGSALYRRQRNVFSACALFGYANIACRVARANSC